MLYRRLSLGLALVGAIALCAAARADDKSAKGNTHQGKFVSAEDHKLTMTDKKGEEHTHTVAKDAKITCDGKTCTLEDLKKGITIRVTTKEGDRKTAVKVEGFTKAPPPGVRRSGRTSNEPARPTPLDAGPARGPGVVFARVRRGAPLQASRLPGPHPLGTADDPPAGPAPEEADLGHSSLKSGRSPNGSSVCPFAPRSLASRSASVSATSGPSGCES